MLFGGRSSLATTIVSFRLVMFDFVIFLALRFTRDIFLALRFTPGLILPSMVVAAPRSSGILLGDGHPLQPSHLVDATLRTIRNDDLPPPQQFLLPQADVRMTNAAPPPIVEIGEYLLFFAVGGGGDPTGRGGPGSVRGSRVMGSGASGVVGEGSGFGGGCVVSVRMWVGGAGAAASPR